MNANVNANASAPRSPQAPSRLRVARDVLLGRPAFALAAGVLLLAAVGLNASVQFLQLHFKKAPVPIRQGFEKGMPRIAGSWVQVLISKIDEDTKAALGTDEYLFCWYVDASALGLRPEELLARFDGKDYDARDAELHRIIQSHPEAALSLGLSYYTGSADTVAHVPERCYVAQDFNKEQGGPETWHVPGRGPLDVQRLSFKKLDRRGGLGDGAPGAVELRRNVAYVFHCNGRYTHNSFMVRAMLQDLFVRHGYYAKVEMMSVTPDAEASRRSMESFLGAAMGAIEACLPDWSQYGGDDTGAGGAGGAGAAGGGEAGR